MRLWSLHPRHLDRIGLVACWREALLAQAVLAERTKGYRHHPQLLRFRAAHDPLAAIGRYLDGIAADARRRGYRFDSGRILRPGSEAVALTVTLGQLDFEWRHLGEKLRARSPDGAAIWLTDAASPHPIFSTIPGGIELWERASSEPKS